MVEEASRNICRKTNLGENTKVSIEVFQGGYMWT